jgi:hypothetical protein
VAYACPELPNVIAQNPQDDLLTALLSPLPLHSQSAAELDCLYASSHYRLHWRLRSRTTFPALWRKHVVTTCAFHYRYRRAVDSNPLPVSLFPLAFEA